MKLLRFKPITPYFFGYNETFGKKGSNYFVTSALFPQQTAILGAIRKEILSQAGLLKRHIKDEWVSLDNRKEAIELVGVGKFRDFNQKLDEIDINESKINNKFNLGKIKSISPIFIMNKDKKYFRAPDINKIYKKQGEYVLEFDYKNFSFIFVSEKGEKKNFKEIFESIDIVGNSIKDKKDSLFKKKCFILKDDFEFACLVDLDFELKNNVIKLGADNSLFSMSIEEVDYHFDNINIEKYFECEDRVSLVVGDSYIKNLKAQFGVIDEIRFKTIKQSRKFKKLGDVNLYAKGSLFVNLDNSLVENAAKKIGFNHIKELV